MLQIAQSLVVGLSGAGRKTESFLGHFEGERLLHPSEKTQGQGYLHRFASKRCRMLNPVEGDWCNEAFLRNSHHQTVGFLLLEFVRNVRTPLGDSDAVETEPYGPLDASDAVNEEGLGIVQAHPPRRHTSRLLFPTKPEPGHPATTL